MYKNYVQHLSQWLRIARLLPNPKFCFVFTIICIAQSFALTKAQTITLDKKDIPIEEVFKQIRKQTDYDFVYSKTQLKGAKKVSIRVQKASLKNVLDICFADQPFAYEIQNKTVLIKTKAPSFRPNVLDRSNLIDVRGIVLDEQGNPLVGATVSIKGGSGSTASDQSGQFLLQKVELGSMLLISYLGYARREIEAKVNLGNIRLSVVNDELSGVEIVSTGYQQLPKERATGAFTTVDAKTINRSTGINILDRLEGVTSGLLLNRGMATAPLANNPKISVRGRSTIFANAEPLIVLNGFPYEGTIDQINPADIENINVLKDAAAASIWGSRSGNGVVVITTRTGRRDQKLLISANSTVTISEKPDLYYQSQISSPDFVELEQFLFSKGYYNSRFSNPYNIVSPAVEIFNQRKNKLISSLDSANQIDALKSQDVRKDIEKYVYQHKVHHQHQVNLRGGSKDLSYYFSAGYDKVLENLVADSYDRVTINNNNNYYLLKNKLKFNTDLSLSISNDRSAPSTYNPYSPYERMADDFGNSLSTVKDYRKSYVDTAGKGKLFDWHYYPKDELKAGVRRKQIQYRIKSGLVFEVLPGLSVNASYQYLTENARRETNSTMQNYLTRDRINRFSSISNGIVNYVIPEGNAYLLSNNLLSSHTFRSQLEFQKTLAPDHQLNAIAGYEGIDTRRNTQSQSYHGYDPATQTHVNGSINPLNNYKLYYNESSQKISVEGSLSESIAIRQSFYANAAYTYKGKYILSGSVRRDESNIFGVKTNQKGVPLWSSGFAWRINPELKARISYGYNGNVDNSVSAFLTSGIAPLLNLNGSTVSSIINPPNPDLRWEKVKTWNLGFDYSLLNNRITGSIDGYQKRAVDLIGNNLIAFQSGISQYRGNGAHLKTTGMDLIINSSNLLGEFGWRTTALFNINMDEVTKYTVKQSTNMNVVNNNAQNPLVGYPYNAVFSLRSAGLDATGAPQGFLDGAISKDYSKIYNTLNPDELIYHGSAAPKYFGSLINTFNFKSFELSFNVVYKFDYYFRRSNVFSGSNFGSSALVAYSLADYDKRWQKPGDELVTRIPALSYPSVAARNLFFSFTDDLVERGDHIRLQDLRLSYDLLSRPFFRKFIKGAEVFAYGRNLGILWRKNKVNIDPDVRSGLPSQLSGSIGLNLTL